MVKIENYFNELILFDGTEFESFLIEGETLRIFAKNVVLSSKHPFSKNNLETVLKKATLVFEEIRKSVRIIHEYAGNPATDGFLTPYEVKDFFSVLDSSNSKTFEFDGIMINPLAHVDWIIECECFSLEIPFFDYEPKS